MIGYGGRGGGGGFGGFPYRSSHQQGQDGRRGSSGNNNNNRDGGRGGRRGPARGRQPRRPNYNPYYAELQIPQDQRGIIVGKGGSALRWLNGVTNAKVIVPHYLQQHRRGRGRRDPQNSRSGNDENDNNDQSTVQQHFEETNPQHQQQHPEQQQQQQQQQQHPVRVNSNDLPSLIHSFCEISSLLSQTNLNAPSIPCSVKMKSNGRNQRNAQHDPSAMDVKILGDLMIHTPLSHSLLSHSSTHAEDNCQESLVFRGTIILPSQTGCNNATPTPITTPVAAHVLETILEEEDIVTIVDNVRFVDASASESCQWYFREVPHRYWSLERNQQQQRQQQQYQHGDPVGNTINGERTSLQPNGDDNTSCNATDRDDSTSTRRLVFVFGSNEDHLQRVCRAIVEATAKAWMKHCYDSSFYSTAIETELGQDDEKTDEESKQQNVRKSNDSNNEKTFPFSIGTYNLLHPTYALKYHQPMGLNALGGSNWKQWRAPAISAILEQSALDVYFLQEVDADQLKEDIMTSSSSSSSSTPSINRNKVLEGLHYLGNKQKINCLAEMYESIHFTHPTREARDGVAILVKTSRFDILESTMVPFSSKLPSTTEQNEHAGEEKHNVDETNNHYMCAATAVVRDKLTDVTFLLACVHLYDKKCVSPQKTLLEYIHTKVQSNAVGIDAVIWGGDCNRDYGLGKESIVFDGVEYRPVWYPGKMNNDVDDNTSLRKMDSCSGLHSSSLWDKDKKIDWIFYRVVSRNDGLRISSSIDEVCIDFMARTRKTLVSTHSPPSDHFAVAATISVSK